VEVVEALLGLATVGAATNQVEAAEIYVEILVLPPGEDVHRCGVDLLDETHAPALYFRAAHEHAVVERAGGADRSRSEGRARRSEFVVGSREGTADAATRADVHAAEK